MRVIFPHRIGAGAALRLDLSTLIYLFFLIFPFFFFCFWEQTAVREIIEKIEGKRAGGPGEGQTRVAERSE